MIENICWWLSLKWISGFPGVGADDTFILSRVWAQKQRVPFLDEANKDDNFDDNDDNDDDGDDGDDGKKYDVAICLITPFDRK